MAKQKIYELAKELNKSSKDVMDFLNKNVGKRECRFCRNSGQEIRRRSGGRSRPYVVLAMGISDV